MAIRFTLPNTWRSLEAKQAVVAAGKILAHNSRYGVKSEPLTVLRSDLRAFAAGRLVGLPGNRILDQLHAQQLSQLVVRTMLLSTREAAAAGAPQPPIGLLTNVVAAVNRREAREGLAGACQVV